jgi:uncharacterized repeat protein (TIGR01451 family)
MKKTLSSWKRGSQSLLKWIPAFAGMTLILYFFFLLPASAQYGPYGPAGALTILIDKTVGKPTGQTKGGVSSLNYVDNLSVTDYKFKPGQEIFFQLKVKNTSGVSLSNVTVKDYVPSYLEPIEGPGNFDEGSRIITISAGNFSVDEEKVYVMKMKIFSQDKLPADKGLFCLVNKADASTGGTYDDDTSQFCIEKEVLAAAKVPSAGPEMGLLLISAELAALGAGIYLKKKTS